jgi:hypothetical protein
MLLVLFSWIVIGAASFIFGKAVVDCIYRKDLQCMGKPDVYIVTGLAFLNIYAQLFSVIYKVAGIACTILGLAGIILTVLYVMRYLRRDRQRKLLPGVEQMKMPLPRAVLLLLCLASVLLWTTQDPGQYDTGLYHAQAIRWIEEYGVVPGLGNLHMRFAYNSAFMSLQALFSLEWLVGQSLHTLNGFFCLCALFYAFGTVRVPGKERWQTSDLLKCVMAVYVVRSRYSIASSGTDIWAMLLIVYICAKWCELMESGEQETAPWCYVCLVGFYALTVKLSAAAIVILVCYPLYQLLRKKDFRAVFHNGLLAVMVVAPYLIRNVIISGYLIYPYEGIDLFNVDWKMDPEVLRSDSLDIKMWGRGLTNMEAYDNSLFGWIPDWFLSMSAGYRILLAAGVICTLVILYRIWKQMTCKKYEHAAVLAAGVVCLVFWLMAAPLIRYGQVYVLIVIALALGGWEGTEALRRRDVLAAAGTLVMLSALVFFAGKVKDIGEMESKYWLRQPPYGAWPATQVQMGNVIIWEPDDDLIGYPAFPSTPQGGQLNHLQLRGEGLADGFRYTEEAWR